MEDAGAVEYARMEALSPIAEFKEGPLSVEALKSESGHRFVLVQNERTLTRRSAWPRRRQRNYPHSCSML